MCEKVHFLPLGLMVQGVGGHPLMILKPFKGIRFFPYRFLSSLLYCYNATDIIKSVSVFFKGISC